MSRISGVITSAEPNRKLGVVMVSRKSRALESIAGDPTMPESKSDRRKVRLVSPWSTARPM